MESNSETELSPADIDSDSDSDLNESTQTHRRLETLTSDSDDSEQEQLCLMMHDSEEFHDVFPDDDVGSRDSFPFSENLGPKNAPPHDDPPISYFNLFFTSELWNMIVEETNRHARNHIDSRTLSTHSRSRTWRDTTVGEIKAFVAVIMEMGCTKRSNIMSYWSKGSRCIPWFGKMIPRNRFLLLLKYFHLINDEVVYPSEHPQHDPCIKFKPLVIYVNKIFRRHYVPHQYISVDESSVGTKNHTLQKEKQNKYGVKFWMLSDPAVNYCLGLFCYGGVESTDDYEEIKSKGLAHTVVMRLLTTGNCLNKGYHVTTDRSFTNIPLARFLYELKTYTMGPMKNNRCGIPESMKSQIPVNASKYCRSGDVLLTSYRERTSQRWPTILLSTRSKAENSTVTKRHRGRDEIVTVPSVVRTYNSNKYTGADVSDTNFVYLDEKRSLSYWKKVAFNILSRMVLNSYVIYKENTVGKPLTRYEYVSSIIESIEKEWMTIRNESSSNYDNRNCPVRKLPGRLERKCVVCSTSQLRKRSRTVCVQCGRGVHSECIFVHLRNCS